MQCVLEDWTVAVAGAWNTNIFSPPWVAANLFQGQNVNIEMQLGAAIPAVRYHHGRVSLVIRPDMLFTHAREATADAMNDGIQVIQTVLGILSHTPVLGLGINFGFMEEHPSDGITENFNIADNQKLIEFGGAISQTSIQREVTLDGHLLRLRETIENNGSVRFHLNFHYETVGADAASHALQEYGPGRHARALALMHSIYNLQPE
jgi:hypothetical protein